MYLSKIWAIKSNHGGPPVGQNLFWVGAKPNMAFALPLWLTLYKGNEGLKVAIGVLLPYSILHQSTKGIRDWWTWGAAFVCLLAGGLVAQANHRWQHESGSRRGILLHQLTFITSFQGCDGSTLLDDDPRRSGARSTRLQVKSRRAASRWLTTSRALLRTSALASSPAPTSSHLLQKSLLNTYAPSAIEILPHLPWFLNCCCWNNNLSSYAHERK